MSEFNFYQITAGFPALMENEEISQEDKKKIEDELNILLQKKSKNVIGYAKNIDLTISAMKKEEKRISDNRKALENKLNKFKDYVKESMERNGISKIETELGTLSIVKNPISVEVIAPEQVPDEYLKVKTTIEVDKAKIKKTLKMTGEVPDGIKIVNDNYRLDIK